MKKNLFFDKRILSPDKRLVLKKLSRKVSFFSFFRLDLDIKKTVFTDSFLFCNLITRRLFDNYFFTENSFGSYEFNNIHS